MKCPKCGSEMHYETEEEEDGLGYSHIIAGGWECVECGYATIEPVKEGKA